MVARKFNIKKPVIYINPPTNCDVCKAPFGDGHNDCDEFFDARITFAGRNTWANVCEECFTCHNGELGIGKGQKYQLFAAPGKKVWSKVDG